SLLRQNSNVESQAMLPEDCSLKRSKNFGSESDLSRLASTPRREPLKRSNSLSALVLDDKHLMQSLYKMDKSAGGGYEEIQFQDNKNHMSEVLAANDMECDDLSSICFSDVLLSDYIEEIVVSAMSHHLMNIPEPEYHEGRLVISSKSLEHALKIFNAEKVSRKSSLQKEGSEKISQEGKKADTKCEAPTPECKSVGMRAEYAARNPSVEDTSKKACEPEGGIPPIAPPKPEVAPDNEFEKRIRPAVIPAGEVGVSFADIGALENVEEALQELVMLPLRRPDLFKGGLLKPCRGILLFGPPGTGKTMLAKALATEAGASFINVSMSTITSKWFGEDEKNVKALFTLAAKVSPTVIFIDEVDSMLGQRTRVCEHEAMRKIKNEFMMNWDGLLTKPTERILVLAATNRPFDLDEAIIRRFER
ncbi:hypothetical protein KI387_037453, partial [Taxus chinensis]